MGNSHQKEQIEQFHLQKLQQIQNSNNQNAQISQATLHSIREAEKSRMARSQSMPQSSAFRPSINHIAVINHPTLPQQQFIIPNRVSSLPRSQSLFKPVLKQIILQPPPQQTPLIKLAIPNQVSSYSSLKIIQPQGLGQSQNAPLQNVNLNQSSQQSFIKLSQAHQVSPLSFINKKGMEDTKSSITPFELNKSDLKNDENISPYKRDSHWRVDKLLQAIQPNQQPLTHNNNSSNYNLNNNNHNISQSTILDLNFNSIKPMSSQVQTTSTEKQSALKLHKVHNEIDNLNSNTKVRFENDSFENEEDKLYTPPRVKQQKMEASSNKFQDKNSEIQNQSLSIKEQFEYFDSVLQKQLNFSQSRNQKVQIKNILSQQDHSDQKQVLQPVVESNEDEYKYSKNTPSYTNPTTTHFSNKSQQQEKVNIQHNVNDNQHNSNNRHNIHNSVPKNIQNDNTIQGTVRMSPQQFSSNTIKFSEMAEGDIVKEKEPQSCYQSEIKNQDQIEESSFIQQISFLNQKIELTDQIREQKQIQEELKELQELQQKQAQRSPSPIREKQIDQNGQKQQPQQMNPNAKTKISQSSHQGLVHINNQVLQPKNQLKLITNQLEYCEEQMQKSKNMQISRQGFPGSAGQLKTIAQLPTGQTYYYFQPQGAILYQQQQNSPIKNLQMDLINTHSLDAGLISPNNNLVTYQRNVSPHSNLGLPVSFAHKDAITSGQLSTQHINQQKYVNNKSGRSNISNQQDINLSNLSTKNLPQEQSFMTDTDHVRMASVNPVHNNVNLSPINHVNYANEVYYHQPQWNTKESDKIFSQNMQNRILDARLDEEGKIPISPQTPPQKNKQQSTSNGNVANQSKNTSSISSAYTFNQKAYENRSEKHKIKHFTLKIDSVKKEITNSDGITDSVLARESTLNLTDQKYLRSNMDNVNDYNNSQNYSPTNLQKRPENLIKKIENIQDNVKRSIMKSNELNEMLSQTLNATQTHDSRRQQLIINFKEGETVELEPYPEDQQNVASNQNSNHLVSQSEKSPIRKSKIKIYHGKIEHIKLSQQQQTENLILYKLDEQLNALIPVMIENNSSSQELESQSMQQQLVQQPKVQEKRPQDYFNNCSPIKSYEELLQEQYSGSQTKKLSSNQKHSTYDDIINGRSSRSISRDRNSANKSRSYQNSYQQQSDQNNNNNNKVKYFQHQVNPETKDNAYHQVLMKYSDKMLSEITKSMLVPNSYQYQHLNQKLYKQKQTNSQMNQSTLSSAKKSKYN